MVQEGSSIEVIVSHAGCPGGFAFWGIAVCVAILLTMGGGEAKGDPGCRSALEGTLKRHNTSRMASCRQRFFVLHGVETPVHVLVHGVSQTVGGIGHGRQAMNKPANKASLLSPA